MSQPFQTEYERHPASFSRGPACSTMLALLLLCSFLPATTAATAAVLSDDSVRLVQNGPHGAERDRREPRASRSLDRTDRRTLAAHRVPQPALTTLSQSARLAAPDVKAQAIRARADLGDTLAAAPRHTPLHLDLPPPITA